MSLCCIIFCRSKGSPFQTSIRQLACNFTTICTAPSMLDNGSGAAWDGLESGMRLGHPDCVSEIKVIIAATRSYADVSHGRCAGSGRGMEFNRVGPLSKSSLGQGWGGRSGMPSLHLHSCCGLGSPGQAVLCFGDVVHGVHGGRRTAGECKQARPGVDYFPEGDRGAAVAWHSGKLIHTAA